jgi:hypothetical protein
LFVENAADQAQFAIWLAGWLNFRSEPGFKNGAWFLPQILRREHRVYEQIVIDRIVADRGA